MSDGNIGNLKCRREENLPLENFELRACMSQNFVPSSFKITKEK